MSFPEGPGAKPPGPDDALLTVHTMPHRSTALDPGEAPPGGPTVIGQFASSVSIAARRHLGGLGAGALVRKSAGAIRSRVIPLLWNLRAHLELTRLLGTPELAGLRQRHPRLEYKYLSRYLALHLSTSARLTILTHHLECMRSRAVSGFLTNLFDAGSVLWKESRDGHSFAVEITYPHSFFKEGVEFDQEGDLSLVFNVNGTPASFLSFTIAPGSAVGAPDADVLFVAAVQGVWGRGPAIKVAERALNYTPAMLLLAAAQALAQALGATAIVGVGANAQLSSVEAGFQFAYDELWRAIGASALNEMTFRIDVPFPEKPIESIARHHRSRVRRRRQLKAELSEAVRAQFSTRFLRTPI